MGKIEEEQKVIDDLIVQVKLQTNAVVNSVTTVKKLLDVWPEAKELLPETIEKPSSTSLVADVSQLNTIIGLPAESSEEV